MEVKLACLELECTSASSEIAWSAAATIESNFLEAYSFISNARFVHSGVSALSAGFPEGERVLHWEVSGGVVCFKEYWLCHTLLDNALCIRLGDETMGFPVAVFIDDVSASREAPAVKACFLMPDGQLLIIKLGARSKEESVLAHLVRQRQGRLVDFVVDDDLRSMHYSSYKIQQIPETCSIKCGSWQSSDVLAIGLTQGAILCVQVRGADKWDEQFLRDGASKGYVGAISQWWSSGSSNASGSSLKTLDVAAMAACSSGIFSVDSNGMVTFWGRAVAQINAMHAWREDKKRENVGHLNAKICVLENPHDGRILVAVAIDFVTDGTPDWEIALFNFHPQGSHEVLGVLAVLTECNTDDSPESLLVDMQFSPETSMDGKRCLNTLWRSLDKSHRSERETSITTNLYTSTFEPNRPRHRDDGLDSDSNLVESNGVDSRMDKWREDLETKAHFNPRAFDSFPALYTAMMQRIFLPGRFATRIILEVLMNDVPFELQLLPDTAPPVDELAEVAEHVLLACRRWAEIDSGKAASLENASFLAFFSFIELCQKRATAEDDFGGNCLLTVRHAAADAGSKIRCFVANRGRLSLVTVPTEGYNLVVVSPDGRFSSFLNKALSWDETCKVLAVMKETIYGHIQDFPVSAYSETVEDLSELLLNHIGNKKSQMLGELKFLVDASPSDVTRMLGYLYPQDFDAESDESFTKLGYENPSATNPQVLVSAIARMAVAKMYRHYEEVSVALAIVFAVLSVSGKQCDEARESLSRSLKHMLYYGFLQWLDKVHPTDASDLRRSIDLGYVLPNSCLLSQQGQKNSKGSVLGNFWNSGERGTLDCLNLDKRSPIDWIKRCARQCVHVLSPSPVGDLANYLLGNEQYSCLARLASLLQLLAPNPRQIRDNFSLFSDAMLKSRTQALHFTADFYECLRRHAQMRGSEMTQADKLSLLQNVDAILASAPPELHLPEHPEALMNLLGDNQEMDMDDFEDHERIVSALDEFVATSIVDEEKEEKKDREQVEAIRSVHDPLKKMLKESSSPFSMLMSLVVGKMSRQFLSHPLIQNLCRLNYLTDLLDIFRRARSVLPVDMGAEVCKRTGEFLLQTLKSLLAFCQPAAEMIECLENDFMTTKNRVFNAALENFSFDEAWKAVEHMLALQTSQEDSSGAHQQDDRKAVPQWQICLRSLVSLACDSGHLDWLCDQTADAFLADQVVKELDRLSRSSGIASSGQVNYFECLFTFLFRKGNYSDAAKSLFALAFREENINAVLRSRSLAVAICTLSTRHVDATHQYLVASSSFLSSSWSSSVQSEHEIFFSRQKLALHFLLELAKAEIVSIDPSYPVYPVSAPLSLMLDCERCVRDLSDACRATDRVHLAFLAVSVALQAELVARGGGQDMGDVRNHYNPASGALVALEHAVIVLTDLCAADYRVWNSAAASLSFFIPAAEASDAELLVVLLDVLATQDCGFPKGNWALHNVAIQHVLDNYSGNKKLLDTILTSYLGAAFSSEATTAKVFHDCQGNPMALLKLLMSRGHMEEACDFAVKLLQRLSYSKPVRVWVPYALFDEMLSSCDAHNSRLGVPDAKRALENALSEHFELLLVS